MVPPRAPPPRREKAQLSRCLPQASSSSTASLETTDVPSVRVKCKRSLRVTPGV